MLIFSAKQKAGTTKETTSVLPHVQGKVRDCWLHYVPIMYPRENKSRACFIFSLLPECGLAWVICLLSVWVDWNELGTPRFQLPVPTLLDSWFTAQAVSIAPFFPWVEHLAVRTLVCMWMCHCRVPYHRHFVAQNNLCSFFLFSSLFLSCYLLPEGC